MEYCEIKKKKIIKRKLCYIVFLNVFLSLNEQLYFLLEKVPLIIPSRTPKNSKFL